MLCGSKPRTMWKAIDGYRWPYRINEGGKVQKLDGAAWVNLKPYIAGRNRACVEICRRKKNPYRRKISETSLVVQWLRIHLPLLGTQV